MSTSPANISSDLQLYLLAHCFSAVRLHNIMISTCIFTFQKKCSFKLTWSTEKLYMNTQKLPSNTKNSCFFWSAYQKNPNKPMTTMKPKPHHCMTRLLGILSLHFNGRANEKWSLSSDPSKCPDAVCVLRKIISS